MGSIQTNEDPGKAKSTFFSALQFSAHIVAKDTSEPDHDQASVRKSEEWKQTGSLYAISCTSITALGVASQTKNSRCKGARRRSKMVTEQVEATFASSQDQELPLNYRTIILNKPRED